MELIISDYVSLSQFEALVSPSKKISTKNY